MSGAQVSTFPSENTLMATLSGKLGTDVLAGQIANQRNQLLMPYQVQEAQQQTSGTEMEYMARAAAGLLDPTQYPTTEARAAAYPGIVANLQRYGFAKNAPSEYPGDAQIAAVARMGTPSATQAEWAANIAANRAYGGATGQGGTTPPAGPPVPPYGGGPANQPEVPPEYMPYFQEASQRTGIPVDLLIAQARQESGFNPGATGSAGEIGIMQIHPNTAASPGFGLSAVENPASLRDPRTNINFGADYLAARAKAAGADFSTPAGQAAALRAYNGGGDPNYVANVFRYMPAGGGAATAATATTGGPVVVGDSLASRGGLGGSGVVGASPAAVRAQIADGVSKGAYTGKDVVLSSGASNAPGDMENVEAQLKALRDASSVTLLGVGPAVEAKNPGTNAKLQTLAAQYGAKFVPLPADQMSPDGVHPTAAGYAALKAATAPPGAAPQSGRYQVASNAPTPPPSATAPPAAPAQPPPAVPASTNILTPPAAAATTPPALPPTPPGSPGPPQLQPLNARGLTAQQQAQLDAAASTGRLTLQDRIKQEQALAQLNIGNQQKAFSDWIQTQQLATSQGQLSVSQANSALEYWKAAHPDAKVTLSGGEIITQDPRSGQEIAPRITVVPNQAPRNVEGAAVYDNGQWRQPGPGEQGVPGRWTVGPAGGQFFPAPTEPGESGYKVRETAYNRDSGQVNDIAAKGQAAQMDQVRIREMQDQLARIYTGPGTATKVAMQAWLNTWMPDAVNPFATQTQGLSDAAAAEVFNKLAFRNATTQERSVAGARGAGAKMTEMFLNSNPSLELLTDANQRMLNVMRVANQADIDNTQGALNHFANNEQAFQDSNGRTYTSLNKYNADWQAQRNPEVFAAAAAAAAGLPARDGTVNGVQFKGWANELTDKEEARVLAIVARAAPGTRVNTKGGDIIARPQAPATPPIPPGFKPVQ